ncbi:Pleiotropic drug resistance protein 3 [Camellia lanceoleosa]|uniref:Pleiotropic drug resistance protein 3 n=1 Tax=Camellia lanceoleosa TaxID=1840588 RepID=A0ACC0F8R2_9ERIC|nr:Pleiotropic drug resistance protein 3 [Camellia lanceoleosa]
MERRKKQNVLEPESLYAGIYTELDKRGSINRAVDVKSELVCIHDSARPLVTTGDVKKFILFLALHLAATSMFRFVASVFRTAVASTTAASMPTWLKWGFRVAPLTYGELILLKASGQVIYSGPLGQHSSSVIEYFEATSGVQKIRNNYNPATWMLEITSRSAEAQLCIDFAQVYKNCVLYQNSREHVNRWSTPPPDSFELNSQQGVFNPLCSIFSATIFLGINNSSSVLPYAATERSRCMVTVEVLYLQVQVIAFVIIAYPIIGYYCSAFSLLHNVEPVLWYLIPQLQIPKWWIWMYYLTLNTSLNSSDHRCRLCGGPIKI